MSSFDPNYDLLLEELQALVEAGVETTQIDRRLKLLVASATCDEDKAIAYLLWGRSLLGDQRFEAAQRKLDEALNLCADGIRRGRIYLELAICKLELHDPAEALAAANEAQELLYPWPNGSQSQASLWQMAGVVKREAQDKLRPTLRSRINGYLDRVGGGFSIWEM